MDNIQIFNNEEFGEIRTLLVNDEPYFVGKDVATVLGYTNPSKALIDHVDDDDKLNNESLSSLGQRGGWLVNESGLYKVGRNKLFQILRDNNILTPKNQPYQRFVDDGYFRTIEQKWQTPDGEIKISIKTLVYQKGIDYIRKALKKLGYRPLKRKHS